MMMGSVCRLGTKIVFGDSEEEENRSKMMLILGSGVIDDISVLPSNQLKCVY